MMITEHRVKHLNVMQQRICLAASVAPEMSERASCSGPLHLHKSPHLLCVLSAHPVPLGLAVPGGHINPADGCYHASQTAEHFYVFCFGVVNCWVVLFILFIFKFPDQSVENASLYRYNKVKFKEILKCKQTFLKQDKQYFPLM